MFTDLEINLEERQDDLKLQPSELFSMMKIEDYDEAEKILTIVLEFLVYMQAKDKLITSFATFEKLTSDLIHIEINVDKRNILDSLEKGRIIRIPV